MEEASLKVELPKCSVLSYRRDIRASEGSCLGPTEQQRAGQQSALGTPLLPSHRAAWQGNQPMLRSGCHIRDLSSASAAQLPNFHNIKKPFSLCRHPCQPSVVSHSCWRHQSRGDQCGAGISLPWKGGGAALGQSCTLGDCSNEVLQSITFHCACPPQGAPGCFIEITHK